MADAAPTWTAAHRAMLLAYLSKPRSPEEIAAHLGRRALPHLRALNREGRVSRVGRRLYVRVGLGHAALPPIAARGELRPVILTLLSEPRQAGEIAAHIGRSIPNATGNLGALVRAGLVVRIGYGRYVRADQGYVQAPSSELVQPRRWARPVLDAIDTASTIKDVAARVGITVQKSAYELTRLAIEGLATRPRQGVYRRAEPEARQMDTAPAPHVAPPA